MTLINNASPCADAALTAEVVAAVVPGDNALKAGPAVLGLVALDALK